MIAKAIVCDSHLAASTSDLECPIWGIVILEKMLSISLQKFFFFRHKGDHSEKPYVYPQWSFPVEETREPNPL